MEYIMNSLLLDPIDHEDLLTVASPASNYSMTPHGSSIIARIEWCQLRQTQARTDTELEEWRAEEHGLRDARLSRDHICHYQYSPPHIRDRYALGLQDGRALVRAAWVESIWQPAI